MKPNKGGLNQLSMTGVNKKTDQINKKANNFET